MYQGVLSDPENLLPNGDVGMHKVRTEKFAYISDATYLTMRALDDCSLKLIKQKFYKTGFALAVPERWPYTKDFNDV